MKTIKNNINILGLDYKKEITKFFIFLSIMLLINIGGFFLSKNLLILLIGVLCIVVFSFAYFYRYSLLVEKRKAKNVNLFIDYFSYFRIYIFNGESVYSALEKTIEFADESLKPMIEGLLSEINEDKTINPFIRFSFNFDSKLIEEIMISIYEMIENGNNFNYINQFTSLFENFKNRTNKEDSERRYEKYDIYNNTSLFGSAIIMFILIYGIVNLVGEVL